MMATPVRAPAEPKLSKLAERLDEWFLEDFHPGQVFDLGATTISKSEIIEFASRYDPQEFHVDPVRALDSPYGGLIASGWHTVSALSRLWIDTVLRRTAGLGSPGVDDVRFFAPVRPGDTLTGRAEVSWVRPSEKRAWRGTMTAVVAAINQDGITAAHFTARTLVARRAWVEEQLAEPQG